MRMHHACEKVLKALIIAQAILENVYCHKSNQNMTMSQIFKQQDIDLITWQH